MKLDEANQNRPITVGLFINDLNDPNGNHLWLGAASTLERNGCNLITFPGGSPEDEEPRSNQSIILYELIDNRQIDGLLIWSAPILAYIKPDEASAFFKRYRSLPIVSIGMQVDGIPSLLLDNYQGAFDAVNHLVQVHHRSKIAFVKGPDDHQESNIRLDAYRAALAANQIPFDENLVLSGGFTALQGVNAVHHLVQNKIAFDGILTNDDSVAIAAIKTLQAYQLDFPGAISVIGFDDQAISESAEIPLTTVHIPNYELGQRGAELLLNLLHNKTAVSSENLALQLVIRQSCGCTSSAVQKAHLPPTIALSEPFPEGLLDQRTVILAEMDQASESIPDASKCNQVILDAFLQDLLVNQSSAPQNFLDALNNFLLNRQNLGKNIEILQAMVTAMRKSIVPALASNPQQLIAAENLWQRARIWIAESNHRLEVRQRIAFQEEIMLLQDVSQEMATALDFNQLEAVLTHYLPQMGIDTFYLSIYEDPQQPLSWSRLRIACEGNRSAHLPENGIRFRSPELLPEAISFLKDCHNWTIIPLHFDRDKIGFLLLKVGPSIGLIYQALHFQISSALKRIALQKELMDLSLTDSLTGIGNRRLFEMFLNKELKRNARLHTGLSLIMVDIDEFKEYNDAFGHLAGDQALITIANTIHSCLRRGMDIVVRLGGDEFAALLTETTPEGALSVAESIRHTIEDCRHFEKKVTVSVGVAFIADEEEDEQNIIERCDRALYRSKRNGRNQVSML